MKANVLIDSHGWIEYFSNGSLAPKYATHIESVSQSNSITPTIVLYEVYKRMKSFKGETFALEAIANIVEHTTIVVVDAKICISAAEISLRTKLAMADSIIKATAENFQAKIVTGDPHFKGLSDVVFIE